VPDETRQALLGPTIPGDPRSWTQRVGGLVYLPALLRELGADPVALLADAGLAPGDLEHPDAMIPYASFGQLLELGAACGSCPHLGVLVGRLYKVDDLGVVGELMQHSSTVGDALRTLAVHQQVNSGGGLAYLIERPTVVELGYAIYLPRVVGGAQIFDAVLAAGAQFLRELCGPSFALSEVLLPHGRPADLSPYRAQFHLVPQFDAEVAALRFSPSWLARPIAGADSRLHHAAIRRIERMRRDDLVPRVMRALRLLMLGGHVSGEDTARMLSMHRRTLNRRLKAQGTTFQIVLDRVRLEAARQLLEGTRLPLDDIAASLGYASVSPFMRSFRRWTGMTPGQWRRGGTPARREAA
jgi:AraC-like DNA-binding protein